jgi:hypothetical protein
VLETCSASSRIFAVGLAVPYYLFIKSDAPDSPYELLDTVGNAVVAAKATRDHRQNLGRSAPGDIKMVEAETEVEARTKLEPTG